MAKSPPNCCHHIVHQSRKAATDGTFDSATRKPKLRGRGLLSTPFALLLCPSAFMANWGICFLSLPPPSPEVAFYCTNMSFLLRGKKNKHLWADDQNYLSKGAWLSFLLLRCARTSWHNSALSSAQGWRKREEVKWFLKPKWLLHEKYCSISTYLDINSFTYGENNWIGKNLPAASQHCQ